MHTNGWNKNGCSFSERSTMGAAMFVAAVLQTVPYDANKWVISRSSFTLEIFLLYSRIARGWCTSFLLMFNLSLLNRWYSQLRFSNRSKWMPTTFLQLFENSVVPRKTSLISTLVMLMFLLNLRAWRKFSKILWFKQTTRFKTCWGHIKQNLPSVHNHKV